MPDALTALGTPYSSLRRSVLDDVTGNPLITSAPTGAIQQRSSVLPVGRDDNGALALAVPQAMFDAIDYARAPQRALSGDLQVFDPATGHVSDQAMGAANGLAALAMTGSMPFEAPAGALRMFGGRNAATADHAALEQAQGLLGQGADRKAIWDQTGWFQGPDQKWRFEIPDDAAKLTPDRHGDKFYGVGPAATVMQHEPLYSAYPAFGGKEIAARGAPDVATSGAFSPNAPIKAYGPTEGDLQSTLLHEMQHGVQHQEGFARGGNPGSYAQQDWEKSVLDDAANRKWQAVDAYPEAAQAYRALNEHKNDLLWKHGQDWGAKASDAEMARLDELEAALSAKPGGQQISDADWAHQSAIAQVGAPDAKTKFADWAMDQYRRQAGEVEARNVQTRRDFTSEQRRATPPWETQDVPDAQQIVQFGNGLTALSPQR